MDLRFHDNSTVIYSLRNHLNDDMHEDKNKNRDKGRNKSYDKDDVDEIKFGLVLVQVNLC